jgi:hypothetical protein
MFITKSSKTDFGDGCTVTIQLKKLDADSLKNHLASAVESKDRKERRVQRLDSQIAECSDNEKLRTLIAERGQWQASIDAMGCPYAAFIFAIGESWDLKEQTTGSIKPFTVESILAIHPTRRQKITFNILRNLGYLGFEQAA